MDAPYSSTDKFPRVPLKIAGGKPLQFSHNPNYGCPQFSNNPKFSKKVAYGCPLMDGPLWMPPVYGGLKAYITYKYCQITFIFHQSLMV